MGRRATWLIVVLALALALAGAAGLYVWYWHRVADALAEGLPSFAAAQEARGMRLGWRSVRVEGFPLAFRLRFEGPSAQRLVPPALAWQGDALTAEAEPWRLGEWRLSVAQSSRVVLGTAAAPWSGRLAAVDGTLVAGAGGSATLLVPEVVGENADPLRIERLRIRLADDPARRDAVGAATVEAGRLVLPEGARAVLGREIESLTVAASLVGAIPMAPPAVALEAWRSAGGIVELDRVALRWGDLAVDGSGTLALDRALQPLLAGTAAVSGHIETIDALSANGMMRLGEAIGAKIVLGALTRPDAAGRPTLRVHVSVQDGQVLVGPEGGRSFRVGRVPTIRWPER